MKINTSLLIAFALIIIVSPLNLIAQDTTETEKKKWEWSWEFDELEEWVHFGKKMPSISFLYGLTNIEHKNISDSFADANLLELNLGHTTRRTSRYADNILKYSYRYLYLGYISSDLAGGSVNENQLNSKTWRFGFGRSSGYVYKMGTAAIIPFYTYSFDWTKIDFTNAATNEEDQHRIDRFEGALRFGSSNEGGLRIAATSLITVEASYERSIVFERHLFWKWAGSAIIEAAAQGLIDIFIKEIFYSSPEAGPIVYFVLKSALGYGIYELRQEKMNWPFSIAPPLSFDNIKFGVTFTF